jgi:hypothetical protein
MLRPFLSLPNRMTLNRNDLPLTIIHRTGDLLSKNIIFNSQPLVDCFESDTQFFIECEPVSVNKFIKGNVDLVNINNYYRDLSTSNNRKFFYYRSWYHFDVENKSLSFFNVLENLNHPTTCNRTILYMYLSSDQVCFPPQNDKEAFLNFLSKIKY